MNVLKIKQLTYSLTLFCTTLVTCYFNRNFVVKLDHERRIASQSDAQQVTGRTGQSLKNDEFRRAGQAGQVRWAELGGLGRLGWLGRLGKLNKPCTSRKRPRRFGEPLLLK